MAEYCQSICLFEILLPPYRKHNVAIYKKHTLTAYLFAPTQYIDN